MPRISGVDIPEEKRLDIALTYIYGVGRSNVTDILKEANLSGSVKSKNLKNEEIARLQRVIEKINTEGNLRKQTRENIERLKRIGAYRGARHTSGLPARGQRTRTNARTKRGKKMTIGAISKDTKESREPKEAS